ncbi:MAG: zinc-dependent alcohol dehydrogenase family protein [Propylenella sp.]
MRAYHLKEPKAGDGLEMVELPDPKPRAHEILVKVGAVSLNFRDLAIARGTYAFGTLSLPIVPCSDAAGRVMAVGANVTRFKVGDRAAPIFFPKWLGARVTREATATTLGAGGTGTLAELVAFDEAACVSVPEHLSDAEAACLPCAGVTAWNAAFEGQPIRPGETVVTLGTGGVSLFMLAFAKLAGARVIATTSSEEKRKQLEALGADATINYAATPEWDKAVLDLTGGEGADLVVDVAGPKTLPRSLAAARPGGRVTVIGAMGGPGEINPMPISGRSINVRGIYVGSRAMFESMNAAIATNKLRPVVDRVFPFSEAPDAYRHLAARKHFGKVCIAVGG